MVDNNILARNENEINTSIKLCDKSIDSKKTTMESDNSKCKARSLPEGKESKFAKKLNDSFLEKEKSFLKNPKDYEKIIEESESFEEFKEEIINETITVHIHLSIEDKEYVKFVNVSITNKVTLHDLIKQSVKMFNKLFEEENFPVRLNNIIMSNYKIKPSKKNGKPDYDLPNINFDSTVYGTNIKKFSIVYDPSDLYRVRTKNQGGLLTKCKRCLIF